MQATPNVSRLPLPDPLRTAPDMAGAFLDGDFSFDDAAEKIVAAHRWDGAHRDLPIVDLRTWAVTGREGRLALRPLAKHHEALVLRTSAFSNLAARVGAPADFVRKLPAPMQLALMNYLLSERDDSSATTLRLRGSEVAAVVSGRYAPLDAADLMDTIRDGLQRFGALGEVRVRAWSSGLLDALRIVFPSESVAVEVGDVSSVALDITSSSFGRSSIHVTPVVWRLVCKNGLRAPERRGGWSLRHIGESSRLRDGVAEAIPSALMHARGVMTQWRAAISLMVEDVARMVDELRDLTVPERKNVETELQAEAGSTDLPARVRLYDFCNAITASAKQAAPARRLELESVAGEVLARNVGRAR